MSYGSNMVQEYWKVWPKVAVDFSTKNIKNAASDILNTWLFNTLAPMASSVIWSQLVCDVSTSLKSADFLEKSAD